MVADTVHVSALIPASPQAVYDAWLSSEGHTKMTGAPASVDAQVGGKHSAWDGYISGETLEIEPGKRLVQTWRAADFPEGSGHSRIVVRFDDEGGQTRLVIDHTDIPGGHGERFQGGWLQYYVTPMTAFFGGAGEKKGAKKGAARKSAKKAAAKKPAAKKGAAKKTAKKAAAKKPAAKKAKKAVAKKPAAKKAKKPAAKKAAAPKVEAPAEATAE